MSRFTALVRASSRRYKPRQPSQRLRIQPSGSSVHSCVLYWHGITRSRCGVTRYGHRRTARWRCSWLRSCSSSRGKGYHWRRRLGVEKLGAETRLILIDGGRGTFGKPGEATRRTVQPRRIPPFLHLLQEAQPVAGGAMSLLTYRLVFNS